MTTSPNGQQYIANALQGLATKFYGQGVNPTAPPAARAPTAPVNPQPIAPSPGVQPGAPRQEQGSNSVVDPTQTVGGIVNSLLQKDSPYLQRAQGIANQQSNSRGLLNSSIAAGAGTAAAIDAALGIATPDAGIYNQTRLQNLGFDQDVAKIGLGQKNTLETLAVQQGYDVNNLTLQQRNELERMATAQGFNVQNIGLQQKNNLETLAVQQGYDVNNLSLQQRNELERMAAAQGINRENIQLGLATDLQRLASQNEYDLNRTTVAQKNALELAAVQQGYNRETVAEQFRQQTLTNAQAFGYQTNLAQIQQQYGVQSSAYNVATNIVNQGAQAVSQILADPNISNEPGANGAPSPKQQLIDKQREVTQSQLRTLSGITNVDLSAVFRT